MCIELQLQSNIRNDNGIHAINEMESHPHVQRFHVSVYAIYTRMILIIRYFPVTLSEHQKCNVIFFSFAFQAILENCKCVRVSVKLTPNLAFNVLENKNRWICISWCEQKPSFFNFSAAKRVMKTIQKEEEKEKMFCVRENIEIAFVYDAFYCIMHFT